MEFLAIATFTPLTSSHHFLISVNTRLASLASHRLAASSLFITFASSRCLTVLTLWSPRWGFALP